VVVEISFVVLCIDKASVWVHPEIRLSRGPRWLSRALQTLVSTLKDVGYGLWMKMGICEISRSFSDWLEGWSRRIS
jgi:hypothetical protein